MDENKRQTKSINPIMIQSYFDGELSSEDLEAISHEDLIHNDSYAALAELRSVVRTESELALSDIDGYALLDAINRQIDAETKPSAQPELNPLSQPKRRTSKQFFQRWSPALIGAALFLLSLPGLIHWIAVGVSGTDTPQQPAQTVVVIDSNAQHPQNMVNYQNPAQVQAVMPSVQPASNQLTVEEMDFAIRHLIKRIETLENANQNGVDSGSLVIGSVPDNADNNL